MALLPYTKRVSTQRAGRPGRGDGERGPRRGDTETVNAEVEAADTDDDDTETEAEEA